MVIRKQILFDLSSLFLHYFQSIRTPVLPSERHFFVQLNSVKVGFYTLGNLLSPIDLMYVYHLMYCCGHRYPGGVRPFALPFFQTLFCLNTLRLG